MAKSRMITVGGAGIHLVEEGAGEPLLFLHGNPDSADLWIDVLPKFTGRFRCLAPDLPGFGRSSVPVAFDVSLAGMAGFVEALLRAAEVHDPVNLVAHDFGGIFGLAWATRYPQRVRRIVVGGCPVSSDYRWHTWARVWRAPVLGELSMWAMNRWLFRWELKRGSPTLPDDHIRRTYSLITPTMKRMVLRLYRATDPARFEGWEDGLRSLFSRTPTLVLWGKRDPYVSVRFAERFGSSNIHIFPDCGHWFPIEEPEETSRVMGEFFDSTGQAGSTSRAPDARAVIARDMSEGDDS